MLCSVARTCMTPRSRFVPSCWPHAFHFSWNMLASVIWSASQRWDPAFLVTKCVAHADDMPILSLSSIIACTKMYQEGEYLHVLDILGTVEASRFALPGDLSIRRDCASGLFEKCAASWQSMAVWYCWPSLAVWCFWFFDVFEPVKSSSPTRTILYWIHPSGEQFFTDTLFCLHVALSGMW